MSTMSWGRSIKRRKNEERRHKLIKVDFYFGSLFELFMLLSGNVRDMNFKLIVDVVVINFYWKNIHWAAATRRAELYACSTHF